MSPEVAEQREQARLAAAERTQTERTQLRAARPEYLRLGPPLADFDAAVECVCSCHPTPPSPSLHDGGVSCPCQLSADERAERMKVFFESLRDVDLVEEENLRAEEFDGEAARLGVQARVDVLGAPFVITGVVDGRFFYLRERHGQYQVCTAPDSDPLADVWRGRDVGSVLVAEGSDADFFVDGVFSDVAALRVAVNAVRVASRRVSCTHEGAGWFCPACGVQMFDVLG